MQNIIYKHILLHTLTFSFISLLFINESKSQGLYSSSSPRDIALREIIRREEQIVKAESKISEGDLYISEKDYENATTVYKDALDNLPEAPITQEIRNIAVQKYAASGVKLAKQRASEGKFDESVNIIESITAQNVAPEYTPAKKLLKELQNSDIYSPALTPELVQRIQEVETALKLGKGHSDLGNFDAAVDSYHKALLKDPYNKAARQGLKEVDREKNHYYDEAYLQTREHMLQQVRAAWELPVPSASINTEDLSGIGLNSKTNKDKIQNKLNSIIIPKVEFNDTPISEAIEFLRSRSVQYDPSREGINIVLSVNDTDELDNKSVTFSLSNVPLFEALRYTTSTTGLKFKIEDYSVLVVDGTDDTTELFVRQYRVPPTFLSNANTQSSSGNNADNNDIFSGLGDDTANKGVGVKTLPKARDVLVERGVTFPEGASAYYNKETSVLVVRNTQKNIDLVEALVEDLGDRVDKQVQIMAKFVEITQQKGKELGFDWLLGPFNIYSSERVFGSGGTVGNQRNETNVADFPFTPEVDTSSPVGNNLVTSGLRSGDLAQTVDGVAGLLQEQTGISSLAPAIFSLSGVFTDPQYQVVLRALNQNKGADLLSAPIVTTKSGIPAKIQIITEFIYPTEYDAPQIPQSVGGSVGSVTTTDGLLGTASGVSSFPVTPANPTAFETKELGISLDVNPVIGPDGYTIELDLEPRTIDFEGFINYGSPIRTGASTITGEPTTVTLTDNEIRMPVFSSRYLKTQATVWDGRTVVVGGLISEDISTTDDRVPFLGDLPVVGRLFRSKTERHLKKHLLIFVTAKIIDPSGQLINRKKASDVSLNLGSN